MRSCLGFALIASIVAACGAGGPSAPVTGATATAAAASSPSASAARTAAPSAADSAAIVPGQVRFGDRNLFVECRGAGSPTVIFLVGTDAGRTQMRAIEDKVLATGTAVCDYDRAGTGLSPAAPTEQTDVDIADDLAAALAAAHVPTPYVLVGQSVGGDQAWLFASRHGDDVGGFLLMNAGFFTLDWDAVKGVWSEAEITEEQANVAAGLGEVKQAASPPVGVPYVVMMSTIAQCASTTDVCGRIYPFYEAWGSDLARRTPDGRFVEVAAGHEIFEEHPDAVVREIEAIVGEIP